MENFLIIDGNSIMNRAFYGVPYRSMSIPGGIYTNAIYGFLNTYLLVNDMIKPDYIAVSFDLKAKTFRHEMYEEYKGQRKGMPEELKCQMPIIKEVLCAMNIKILEKETYEADDILGTVSKTNEKKGIHTYILTGDRDSFQLISDSTTVVMPKTTGGKTEYLMYDPKLLKENYNIEPWQIIDVKALMGDSSDNIPGVKGIGEKTAYTLIDKYSSLDNIYENIDSLDASEKTREKLVNDKEMAYLSYKLATIFREVPIEIDYDLCKIKDINKEELYKIFKRLNFSKLMSRFDFSGVDEKNIVLNSKSDIKLNENSFALDLFNTKSEVTKPSEIIYIDNTNIDLFFNLLYTEKEVWYMLNIKSCEYFTRSLDIENSFLAALLKDKIYIIILKDDDIKKDVLIKFAKAEISKYGYNIKQDIRYMFDLGIKDICSFDYDLMIAYYLLDSSKGKYPISFLTETLYSLKLKDTDSKKQLSLFDEMETNNISTLTSDEEYNIMVYLKTLKYSVSPVLNELKRVNMESLFNEIEMPLTETLASMEHYGMYIDKNQLDIFDKEISERINQLQTLIYNIAGYEFNINSTKQLGELLFEKLGLPVIKKNKSGYSTDKEVLEELEDSHEIIGNILEYRQLAKLKSTYVDGLREKIKPNGRIHTTFMQTVTATRKTFIYRTKSSKYSCKA